MNQALQAIDEYERTRRVQAVTAQVRAGEYAETPGKIDAAADRMLDTDLAAEAGATIPAPADLAARLKAAMPAAHEPTWEEFARDHSDAARHIDHAIGLSIGTSIHLRIHAAWNSEIVSRICEAHRRIMRERLTRMREWLKANAAASDPAEHDANGNG